MSFGYILAVALLLDALLGDPQLMPHPVRLIGRVISMLDVRLYPGSEAARRAKIIRGVELCCGSLLAAALLTALPLLAVSRSAALSAAVHIYLLYAAVAWRSLKDETRSVAEALFRGDVADARSKLSRVVGRDTEALDEPAIIRAAVETVAENSVDGIFSVIFYAALGYVICGAAGMTLSVYIFKASSTLDSMVGYENERYRYFGRAGARLDDVLNFIPARLGGFAIVMSGWLLGCGFVEPLRVFMRDRKKHRSPNSAHGESAFAGALRLRLGGGAAYGGVWEERPWLGGVDCPAPRPWDIIRAHELLDVSAAMFSLTSMAFIAACAAP